MSNTSFPIIAHESARSQLLSSWMVTSLIVLDEYHQDQMVAYQRLASSKDVVFLYS
jgi:hypothetical protein